MIGNTLIYSQMQSELFVNPIENMTSEHVTVTVPFINIASNYGNRTRVPCRGPGECDIVLHKCSVRNVFQIGQITNCLAIITYLNIYIYIII